MSMTNGKRDADKQSPGRDAEPRKRGYDLAELVAGMSPENAHPEVDWGDPRGEPGRRSVGHGPRQGLLTGSDSTNPMVRSRPSACAARTSVSSRGSDSPDSSRLSVLCRAHAFGKLGLRQLEFVTGPDELGDHW